LFCFKSEHGIKVGSEMNLQNINMKCLLW